MINVLFVCLGNICRSPMAEAVFRHQVKEAGLDDLISVDSAGTSHWHIGKKPHAGTRTLLDRYGISYAGIYARQVQAEDIEHFDYIIAMDEQNLADLKELADGLQQTGKLFSLLTLLPDHPLKNVPDPYYTGNFQEVYDLIEAASRKLLERIEAEYDLSSAVS